MGNIIRVLLADHHQLFHLGVQAIINTVADIKLISKVTNSADALHLCQYKQPDVLLFSPNCKDILLPHLLSDLHQYCPRTRVLILMADCNETCIRSLVDCNVTGGILKHEAPEKLLEASNFLRLRSGNKALAGN